MGNKVLARWVPRLLTPEVKFRRLQVLQSHVGPFDKDSDFLAQTVTSGEIIIFNKRQAHNHLVKNRLHNKEGISRQTSYAKMDYVEQRNP